MSLMYFDQEWNHESPTIFNLQCFGACCFVAIEIFTPHRNYLFLYQVFEGKIIIE